MSSGFRNKTRRLRVVIQLTRRTQNPTCSKPKDIQRESCASTRYIVTIVHEQRSRKKRCRSLNEDSVRSEFPRMDAPYRENIFGSSPRDPSSTESFDRSTRSMKNMSLSQDARVSIHRPSIIPLAGNVSVRRIKNCTTIVR